LAVPGAHVPLGRVARYIEFLPRPEAGARQFLGRRIGDRRQVAPAAMEIRQHRVRRLHRGEVGARVGLAAQGTGDVARNVEGLVGRQERHARLVERLRKVGREVEREDVAVAAAHGHRFLHRLEHVRGRRAAAADREPAAAADGRRAAQRRRCAHDRSSRIAAARRKRRDREQASGDPARTGRIGGATRHGAWLRWPWTFPSLDRSPRRLKTPPDEWSSPRSGARIHGTIPGHLRLPPRGDSPMFDALYLEKPESGFSARRRQLSDDELVAATPDADVTVRIDYSTLNYKDALALTNRSPVVRRWPMVPGIDGAGVVEAS